MDGENDPVESAATSSRDLYDIASWEPRTRLDRVSVRLYGLLVSGARALVVLVAVAILLAEFVLTGLATIGDRTVGVFILLSVVPALAIAVYLWRTDVTKREPLGTMLVTFIFGVLFAGFAAVLNSIADPLFGAIPLIGLALFYYLVVAPVEEAVKWLAVRLYAFRRPEFDAVIDGAVYGAVAGLGFATIENAVYIGGQYLEAAQAGGNPLAATFSTAAVRTFAGPGHVIYSAFAGYYLGLAKYNPDRSGPIVVKGLLIAALAHGTYNTLVGIVPALISAFTAVTLPIAFIAFVVAYNGSLGYLLYRKISRYRAAYRETNGDAGSGGDGDAPGTRATGSRVSEATVPGTETASGTDEGVGPPGETRPEDDPVEPPGESADDPGDHPEESQYGSGEPPEGSRE
jgi:RsiW-degrading membrane proteinase PrsW (M82 family)